MVFLVAKWGGNAIVYGALASTYSAFQLIGAPILGRWSDRIGPPPGPAAESARHARLLGDLPDRLHPAYSCAGRDRHLRASRAVHRDPAAHRPVRGPRRRRSHGRAMFRLRTPTLPTSPATATGPAISAAWRSRPMSASSPGPRSAGLLGATVFGEILPVVTALLISVVASLLIAFGLKESRPHILDTKPGHAQRLQGLRPGDQGMLQAARPRRDLDCRHRPPAANAGAARP